MSTVASERHNDDDLSVPTADPPTTSSPRTTRTHDAADVVELNADATKSCGSPKALLPTQNPVKISENLSCVEYLPAFRAVFVGCARLLHILEVIPVVGIDLGKLSSASPLANHTPSHGASRGGAGALPLPTQRPFVLQHIGSVGNVQRIEALQCYPSDREATVAFVQYGRCATIIMDVLQYRPAARDKHTSFFVHQHVKGKILHAATTVGAGSMAHAVVAPSLGNQSQCNSATSLPSSHARLPGGGATTKATAFAERQQQGPLAQQLIMLSIDLGGVLVDKLAWDPHHPYTLALSSPHTHFELWQVPIDGTKVFPPTLVLRPPAHKTRSEVRDMAFSPSDPNLIFIITDASSAGELILYDRRHVETPQRIPLVGPGLSMAFHPLFSDLLAVCYRQGKTKSDCRIEFLSIKGGGADAMRPLPSHAVPPPSGGGGANNNNNNNNDGGRESTAAAAASGMIISAQCEWVEEIAPLDYFATINRLRWRPTSFCRLSTPNPDHHYLSYVPSPEMLAATIREQSTNAMFASPSADHANISRSWAASSGRGSPVYRGASSTNNNNNNVSSSGQLSIAGLHAVASQLWFGVSTNTDVSISVWDAVHTYSPICQVKYPGEVNEPTDFVWVNEVTIITVHRNGHVYITSLLNSMAVSEGIEQQHVGATRMEAVGLTTLDSSWTSPLRLPPPVRTTGFLERVVSSLAEQSPMMAVGGPQMLSDAQVAEVLDLLYRCYSRDEMVEVCSMLFILPTVSMDVDFFGRSFAVRNSAESQRTYYRRTLRRECAQLAVRMMVQLHYENQRRGQPAMSSAEAEGRSCSFNTQPLPEMLQPRSLTEDGGAMDLARPTAFVSTPITTATARQHQQQQPQQQHDADPTSSRVTPPMPLAEVEAPRPSSISPSMPHANPTRRATSVVAPPSSPSFFARLWGLVNPAAAEAPRRGGIRGRRRGASTPSTRGVPPPISTAVALSSPRTAINTSTAATSAIPIANACVGRADPNSATLASHTLVANATLRSDVASVGGADVCSQHLLTSPPQQHGGGGDAWRSAEFSWISDVEPRAAAPPSMCFATILPLITSSTNNTHADRRDAAMLRMQAASPPILLSPDGSSSAANNMSCQSTYTLADRIPSPMSPLPARSSSAQPPTASILKWPTTPTPPTSATQHRVAASTTEEASREVSSASAKSTPHVEELSATTSARQTLSAANTNNNNSQRINIRGNAKRVIRLASGRGPPVIESFVCSREVSGWAYTERRYEEDLFAQFALEWEMGYELALAMKHQRHRRDDAAERKKSSFYALDGWASNTSARGLRLSELEEDDPATTSPHHIDNIFANMMIRNARICADALRACEWEKVERDIRRVHGDAGGQPARHQLDSWRSLGVFLLSEGRSKRAGEDAAPSAAAGASPATGDPRSQWWMAAAHAWRTHDVSVIVVVATSQLQYASLVGDVQFALVLYILFCLWWRMRFGSYEPRSEEGAETDEKMHGRTTTHTTTTTTSSSSASSPAAANRSSSGAAQSMVRLSVPCPLLPEKVDESAMTCSAPDADATNNNNNNGHAVDGRPPYVPVRRRCFESPLSSAPASPPPAESVGELHNDCSPEEWRTRALQWLEAYTDNLYARKLYVPLNELLLIIPEILQEPSNPVQPRASEIAYEKQTTYVFCGAAGCTAVKSELLSRLPPPHSHLSMNALRGDGGGLHRRRKQHRGVLRSSSRDSLDSHSSEYSSDGLHAASTSEEDEVSIASLSDVTEVMDVGSLSHSRGSTTNNNNNMHAHHHPHLRSDDSFVGAQTSRIQVPSADVRPPRRVGAAVWRGSGGVVVAEAGSVGQDEGTTISRSVEAGGGVVVHAMDVLASHDATLPRGAFCPTCSGTELMTCVFCEEVVEGMFYWMRSCGHGAHVEHMEEWLATSNECPKCGVPISTATCNTL